ncbi:MAG: primosomal protein N' [Salinivirgaceae bacterium]|nr:primosomal protein N' [Salinivirgaceae bacterium]
MVETPIYIDVIMPLPVRGFFTYEIPSHLASAIEIGKRALVQFGSKKIYTAVIIKTHSSKPENYETKAIIDVLDETPSLNKFQLRLWEWCADYYLSPIGDFYKAAVPSGLRLESETQILPLENVDLTNISEVEQAILVELRKNEHLTISEVSKIASNKNPLKIISHLIEKKLIVVQEEIRKKYKPKTQKYIQLAKRINSEDKIIKSSEILNRSPKQKQIFEKFIELIQIDKALEGNYISKQKLLDESELSYAILKGILEKNILSEFELEIGRIQNTPNTILAKKALNINQTKALSEIKSQFEKTETVLLHGVTSSGKTEIYIHLIEDAIKKGQQVLYLLPEIALTSQIIHRLKAVFGEKVGVYHSKFSDAERVEIWNSISSNDSSSYQIILGVRSSIFLPFSNLGLIIVDEEHENTYKQFDPSPRYNARDLSVVLASLHKAKVLLGTATPSIESYYNAKTGRYGLVELMQRHQDIKMPEIIVADVKKAYKKKQMQSHFTPELMQQIQEALNNKEQIILFQNRRGFSPYLECGNCGWVPTCKWCDVSLTYHKAINKLVCHYCGYSINSVSSCGKCNHDHMGTKGFGTEKVEDEISIIFPEAKVARLDLDSTRGKHGHEIIINDFQNQHIDILIGTQMVSKGLDFDHVNVVGILNADNMLKFPDFRAYERSYQLMAQVSGRAGRKNKQGKVIIQTYDTENVIINQVIHNNYAQMFEYQLVERKNFFYPPYSRLIKLTVKHRDKNKLNKGAFTLTQALQKVGGCKILGPTTPSIIRIQNQYVKNILIKLHKGPEITSIKRTIQSTINIFGEQPEFKSIQVVIDVDPQ